MADRRAGTPLWGWLIILAALAMFAGLILKSFSTGGGPSDPPAQTRPA